MNIPQASTPALPGISFLIPILPGQLPEKLLNFLPHQHTPLPPPPNAASSEYSPLYAIAAVAAMFPHHPHHHQIHRPSPDMTTELERVRSAAAACASPNSASVAAELRQSLHAYQAALAAAAERATREEQICRQRKTGGGGQRTGGGGGAKNGTNGGGGGGNEQNKASLNDRENIGISKKKIFCSFGVPNK
jgi:hypothetical protein